MRRRAIGCAGFTLLEVVIALAIVAALLAIAFGGLRVGLAAWTRGEDRADVHQHRRTLAAVLRRSIAAVQPYKIAASDAPTRVLLFDGQPDQLTFVTLSPPLPLDQTIAFTAVRLSIDSGDEPGLAIRERALPNRDLFTDEVVPIFRDPAVTALTIRYLRPDGDWEDKWDGASENGLPNAVELVLKVGLPDRTEETLPLTVTLPAVFPTQ